MDWSQNWQFVAHGPPLLLAAAVLFGLSFYLAARYDVRERLVEANVAVLLLAAAGVWIGSYGLELLRTDLAAKVLLNRVGYLGSATLPVLWYEYVRLYVGGDQPVSRRRTVALWTIPVLTLALVFTNGWHSLIWERVYLADAHGFVSLINVHGPAFYVFIAYTYGLVVVGTGRLLSVARETSGARQKQVLTLLAGATLPAVGGAIYVAPWNPVPHLNLPAVAFAAAAGAVAWSVVRDGLFTVVPVGWREVVERLDEAAIVLDTEDRILAYNPAATDYMSRDPVATHGEDARRVLHPTVVTAVWSADEPAEPATNGGEPDGARARSETDGGDGSVAARTVERAGEAARHVEIQRSTLRDAGRQVGSVVVVRDVTDRRHREMRLRAQNERLDQFASVVSHDLRNPLSVARGYTELARESGDDEHFERIEEAHDRIESIVTDLLVLAREGDSVGETETVMLSAAARSAWQFVADESSKLVVADELAFEADRDRLGHLFENLFRNSVEHSSTNSRTQSDDAVEHGARQAAGRSAPGDSVEHSSTSSRTRADAVQSDGDRASPDSEADGVTIEVGSLPEGGFYVEDDGPGIPREVRERVFERGFSTDDGTGLGLAIVSEIASAHDWTPSLHETDSGGARFEFAFDAE